MGKRSRILASFLTAPIIPVLLVAWVFWGPEADPSDPTYQMEVHPMAVLLVGSIISYSFMLCLGLPTILAVEYFKTKKSTAIIIYLLFSTFLPSLIFFSLAPIVLPLAAISGAITSFIMLYKREDWDSAKSC